jgi:eukaryotic-like serine/threonine-protein kinase
LMYTLATGEQPFLAQARKIGWEQAILENSPKRPTWLNSKIPQELEKIVLRAMSRDRAQRYSSVMNIWVELQSLVSKPVAEVKKPKRRRAA